MAFDGRYFKSFFDNRNKFLDRMSRDSTDIMNAGLNLGDRFLKAKQEAARLRSGEVLAREGEAGATERTRMAQAGETSRLDTSIGAQKAMQTEKIGAESEQARLDRENRADMLTAELEARGKLQTQADEAAWERTLMEIDAAFRRSANEGEAAMQRVREQIEGDKAVAQIRVNADAESKLDPNTDIMEFLSNEMVFRPEYIPTDPQTQQPDLTKVRADEKIKSIVLEDLNKWLNNKTSYTPEMKQAVIDSYQQWLSGIEPVKINGGVPATGVKEAKYVDEAARLFWSLTNKPNKTQEEVKLLNQFGWESFLARVKKFFGTAGSGEVYTDPLVQRMKEALGEAAPVNADTTRAEFERQRKAAGGG